ncbi:hypothetical protein [Rhodopseudomonas sp. BR0M22]|uniref:hypothetical protein n=1 Tax=Rhodopseudomonas sp. BR0M22 TaxID=2269369 RepID=UPI0013DEC56B|nr:hypothetical protein [Rhodopseudomonas sp. BR0M22]
MADKPTPEMIARADRLRERIDKLTRTPPDGASDDREPPASPRDFIEREMRKRDVKE